MDPPKTGGKSPPVASKRQKRRKNGQKCVFDQTFRTERTFSAKMGLAPRDYGISCKKGQKLDVFVNLCRKKGPQMAKTSSFWPFLNTKPQKLDVFGHVRRTEPKNGPFDRKKHRVFGPFWAWRAKNLEFLALDGLKNAKGSRGDGSPLAPQRKKGAKTRRFLRSGRSLFFPKAISRETRFVFGSGPAPKSLILRNVCKKWPPWALGGPFWPLRNPRGPEIFKKTSLRGFLKP